jgi:alkylhydroperoxidase family enzyme
MTRTPPPPQRTDFEDEHELEAYDEVVATRAHQFNASPADFTVTGYYGSLLNSPPYARAQLRAAYAFRSVGNGAGSYSHSDREWVDQVISHELRCYKFLALHTRDAVALGVRLEALEALWEGREQDFTDDERLLTQYIRQVANGTVDDATWNAMLARLGLRGLVEYTAFIGHLIVVLRMHQALGVPGALESQESVLELIRAIRAGTVDVPDPVDAVRVGR